MEQGILTKEKVLYRKMKSRVLMELTSRILKSEHDLKVAGHFGQDKTIELIRRNFW